MHSDGTKDLAWFGPDGTEMEHERWHDPWLRTLQMYLHAVVPDGHGGHVDESLLVVVQGAGRPVAVRLPGPPWAARYRLLLGQRARPTRRATSRARPRPEEPAATC